MFDREKSVTLYVTKALDREAEFALALVERWGLVAGVPEGEDSAGRAQLRLLTPAEVVARAFDCAKLAYAEAEKRGLVIDLPDLNEVNKEVDAKNAARVKREAKEEA